MPRILPFALFEAFSAQMRDPFSTFGTFLLCVKLLEDSDRWFNTYGLVADEIESYWVMGQEAGEREDFRYYVDLTGDQVHDGAYLEGDVDPGQEITDEDFDAFIFDMERVWSQSPTQPAKFLAALTHVLRTRPEVEEDLHRVLAAMPPTELDAWIRQDPFNLDLLDSLPEIKRGVLQRTQLPDISGVASSLRTGLI